MVKLFYGTLFHEMSHASGAQNRLNRFALEIISVLPPMLVKIGSRIDSCPTLYEIRHGKEFER